MTENPNYYAIIPANVRYDKRLMPNAKLLYAEITALCKMNGKCFASNEYFANLYGVSKKSISQWIGQLVDCGYLKSEIVYKDGSKEILHRYLTFLPYPIEENFYTPMEEKVMDNINLTDSNNNLTDSNRYGELKLVRLSLKEYEKLKDKYSNLDEAIEKLDTWLGTSGGKYKNKPSHYAYFKENSWLWEKVKKQKNEVKELVW